MITYRSNITKILVLKSSESNDLSLLELVDRLLPLLQNFFKNQTLKNREGLTGAEVKEIERLELRMRLSSTQTFRGFDNAVWEYEVYMNSLYFLERGELEFEIRSE